MLADKIDAAGRTDREDLGVAISTNVCREPFGARQLF
jgi:hypothetical protein